MWHLTDYNCCLIHNEHTARKCDLISVPFISYTSIFRSLFLSDHKTASRTSRPWLYMQMSRTGHVDLMVAVFRRVESVISSTMTSFNDLIAAKFQSDMERSRRRTCIRTPLETYLVQLYMSSDISEHDMSVSHDDMTARAPLQPKKMMYVLGHSPEQRIGI